MIEFNFFRAYSSLKPQTLFYSNGPAIWHGFPDIRHTKVNNGHKSAILNLIQLTFFRAYPSMKPHILSCGKLMV